MILLFYYEHFLLVVHQILIHVFFLSYFHLFELYLWLEYGKLIQNFLQIVKVHVAIWVLSLVGYNHFNLLSDSLLHKLLWVLIGFDLICFLFNTSLNTVLYHFFVLDSSLEVSIQYIFDIVIFVYFLNHLLTFLIDLRFETLLNLHILNFRVHFTL